MADYFAVSETMTSAVAGLATGNVERRSAKAEAALAAGICVVQGAAVNGAKLPATTLNPIGITEYIATKSDGTSAHYDSGEMVSLVTKGHVWCIAEDTGCADGGAVYVRTVAKGTPGATEALGRVRSDADGADSGVGVLLVGAKFRSTQATAGGLVKVEINLPQ